MIVTHSNKEAKKTVLTGNFTASHYLLYPLLYNPVLHSDLMFSGDFYLKLFGQKGLISSECYHTRCFHRYMLEFSLLTSGGGSIPLLN